MNGLNTLTKLGNSFMKKYLIIFTCLILLFTLSSCGKKDHSGFALKENGIVLILDAEPKTFDPAYITGNIGIRVAAALFEGLTVYNEKTLEPEPGIAESWTVSEDGKIYTFSLKETKWSNGDPLTAQDFVFSWERVLNSETASEYAYMLFPIKNAVKYNKKKCKFSDVGIRAEGNILTVTLENPTPYFLDLTSFVTYYPVNPSLVKLYGENWIQKEHFMGNGPFVLEKHLMHDSITLRKNPEFHDAANVKLDKIVMKIIEDQVTGFNEYDAVKADIFTSVPTDIFANIKDSGRSDLHVYPMLATYFFRFNTKRKPFNDKLVRQAIALAVDNDKIVNDITGAGEKPASSFVPPQTAGASSFTNPETYNPEKARELLTKAGFNEKNPFPKVEYLYNTSEDHKKVARGLCDMLKKNLGIEIEPVNMEWKVYLKKTNDLDYDLCRSGWIGDYNDPLTFLNLYTSGNGNNRTGWGSREYDDLIKEIEKETDPGKRKELVLRCEEILADEMPIVPLYYYVSRIMFRPDKIGGIHPNVRNWIRPGKLYKKQP